MQFSTTVELGGTTATGLAVPDEVVAALGPSRRPAVVVTIGGHSYRTTVASMGGRFLVPLSALHREAAGVRAGDDVEVDIELDRAAREVTVPADLAEALAVDDAAQTFFDGLAFTHRKEWVRWIEDAKRPETRSTRLAATVEAMQTGRRARQLSVPEEEPAPVSPRSVDVTERVRPTWSRDGGSARVPRGTGDSQRHDIRRNPRVPQWWTSSKGAVPSRARDAQDGGHRMERDRDERGRARNSRNRDRLGRPMPRGAVGVVALPEDDLLAMTPAESLDAAQRLLDEGFPFQAHEVLEAAWKTALPDLRPLWQGLAQVAVGVTHAERGNIDGAVTLLHRGAANIDRCVAEIPHDVDVVGLQQWIRRTIQDLTTNTSSHVGITMPRLCRADPERVPAQTRPAPTANHP